MVLAGVFAGVGVMIIGLLYLCWVCYWCSVRRMREVTKLLYRPGCRPSEKLRPLYVRQDEYLEQGDVWHTRYHYCLLLGPLFFGLAAFSAVLHWMWEWPLWVNIPLSALSGALVLFGSGWLGYGPVREYVLPLEDVVPQKR